MDDYFVVHGVQMERLFAKADLGNEDAVAYLQQVIERAGLNDALRRAGACPATRWSSASPSSNSRDGARSAPRPLLQSRP